MFLCWPFHKQRKVECNYHCMSTDFDIHFDSVWVFIFTVFNDYAQPTPMELVFEQGTAQQCASISISDDAILENNELFSVQLTTTDQAVMLSPSSATVTIEDDDSKSFSLFVSTTYCVLTLHTK